MLWDLLPDMEDSSAPRFTVFSIKTPKLFVKFMHNGGSKSFDVPYCSTDTVEDLKLKIKRGIGVPIDRQQLTCVDRSPDDNSSALSIYGVQSGCSVVQLTRGKQLCIQSPLFLLQVDFEGADTVAQVKAKIESEISVRACDIELSLGGASLQDGSTMTECGNEVGSTLHMTFSSRSYMRLLVRTLTGDTVTLYPAPDDTIRKVKRKFQHKQGTLPDLRHLLFNGEQHLLYDGERLTDCFSLSYQNVGTEETLLIVKSFEGGGGTVFADVSDTSTLQKWQLDEAAPKWRTAVRGINIEGYCTNAEYEAHDELAIHRVGMTSWPLIDGPCRCPVCKEDMVPEIVAFMSCLWRYDGRKLDGMECKSPFYDGAADGYHRFEGAFKLFTIMQCFTSCRFGLFSCIALRVVVVFCSSVSEKAS
jgi:Ubiquitin family